MGRSRKVDGSFEESSGLALLCAQNDSAPALNAFGERPKRFKLDRAAARMQQVEPV